MRYFTKDWYRMSQMTKFHFFIKEDKRAESFSEEYFQELYNTRLQERIESQREYKESQGQSFSEEDYRRAFQQGFHEGVKELKEDIPENIKDKIADIRVLKLRRASAEVVGLIAELCMENERRVERALEEYSKREDGVDEHPILEENFHDCRVIGVMEDGKTLEIMLDNKGQFTTKDSLRFIDYTVLKKDGDLEGAYWICDELYKEGNSYEFHMLFSKGDELMEFIIQFQNYQ